VNKFVTGEVIFIEQYQKDMVASVSISPSLSSQYIRPGEDELISRSRYIPQHCEDELEDDDNGWEICYDSDKSEDY